MARVAMILGIVLFTGAVTVGPPAGTPAPMWNAVALGLLMAFWWLTEPVPLAVTALLPVALWPLIGPVGIDEVAARYAHPLTFLFLGGFLVAKAVERWGLHRRIARSVLSVAGDGPRQLLAAIMVTTAFLSLWISNTAAAMVMAPIAAAVARPAGPGTGMATSLMLGVAFAATIGGMGSLIGTPPNALYAAFAENTLGRRIGFAEWAAIGVPVSAVLLICAWTVLSWRLERGRNGLLDLPPLPHASPAEIRVAAIAGLTALAWMTRPLVGHLAPGLDISDAGIALAAAVSLFLVPSGQGGALLDWETAASLRWDVLILFGGGLALAAILDDAGVVTWIGQRAQGLQGLPLPVVILVLAALIVGIGELASNTAMAAIFLPVAGAIAVALDTDPVLFTLPVALAASVGFMLPVATPPNAIVFSHESVTRENMIRAGAPLDVIGVVVACGMAWLLGGFLL